MPLDINLNNVAGLIVKTEAQWASDTTVYSAQYLLVSSDAVFTGTNQRKFKIADGVQTWSNLDYFPDVQANLNAHISDTTEAHDAGSIALVPAGSISSDNVRDAIYELNNEKQPLDSDLTAIAGLSPTNDDILQRKAGAWTNRTIPQLGADLGQLVAVLGHSSGLRNDSTSYFYGTRYSDQSVTAWGQHANKFVKDRIIRAASITVFSSTTGSNEASPVYIRVNNTTDYLLGNLDYSQVAANMSFTFNFTGLNITLLSTDTWEIKESVPAMTTNPTNVRHNTKLYE